MLLPACFGGQLSLASAPLQPTLPLTRLASPSLSRSGSSFSSHPTVASAAHEQAPAPEGEVEEAVQQMQQVGRWSCAPRAAACKPALCAAHPACRGGTCAVLSALSIACGSCF